jgi:protein-S-isoprenylcysteine O-methyltransferase Ste14
MTGPFHLVLVLGFVALFGYFMSAGARTFGHDETDVNAAFWAQFSFLFTGAIGTPLLSFRQPVHLWNGVAAVLLLAASLALYEWARRTVRARGFQIAWSGRVPDAVCEEGPYARVRHPVYASYLLAFLAVPVAFPRLATVAVFAVNLALYLHAARSDERSLAQSPLADEYAAYRQRTGMFVPRLRRSIPRPNPSE